MQYEVNGGLKDWEEDVFAHGCQPGTGACTSLNVRLRADSVEELVKKINDFIGNDDLGAVELDACDEAGRIDVQMLETDDGTAPTERELALWKAGELRLWLANYSFQVEAVERRTVELAPLVWRESAAERGEV